MEPPMVKHHPPITSVVPTLRPNSRPEAWSYCRRQPIAAATAAPRGAARMSVPKAVAEAGDAKWHAMGPT